MSKKIIQPPKDLKNPYIKSFKDVSDIMNQTAISNLLNITEGILQGITDQGTVNRGVDRMIDEILSVMRLLS